MAPNATPPPESIATRRRRACAKDLFHGEFRHAGAPRRVSILLNHRRGNTATATATPGDEANATYLQSLFTFFSQLWSPTSQAKEKLGYAYSYDEEGTLIAEAGSGGANSAGNARYIYLPTASGPMPIAAVINGKQYAVHSDHLNTPRRLTQSDGKVAWQWSYSGFGETAPTTAKNRFADLTSNPNPGTTAIPGVAFNLRYPGQYADKESGLFYNYFRTYQPGTGRYVQPDPIGLEVGLTAFFMPMEIHCGIKIPLV